jgi:hypothetical protein
MGFVLCQGDGHACTVTFGHLPRPPAPHPTVLAVPPPHGHHPMVFGLWCRQPRAQLLVFLTGSKNPKIALKLAEFQTDSQGKVGAGLALDRVGRRGSPALPLASLHGFQPSPRTCPAVARHTRCTLLSIECDTAVPVPMNRLQVEAPQRGSLRDCQPGSVVTCRPTAGNSGGPRCKGLQAHRSCDVSLHLGQIPMGHFTIPISCPGMAASGSVALFPHRRCVQGFSSPRMSLCRAHSHKVVDGSTRHHDPLAKWPLASAPCDHTPLGCPSSPICSALPGVPGEDLKSQIPQDTEVPVKWGPLP